MTAGQIETILYNTVSDAQPPVSGNVYYRDTRPEQTPPLGTGLEDVVVAVITGNEQQIQSGTCVVNVYIPDVLVASGAYLRDKQRTDQIESWLVTLPDRITAASHIHFTRNTLVQTLPEPNLRQHFVSLKMDFQTLNENY